MSLIPIDPYLNKNEMNHSKSVLNSIIIPVYNRVNVICNAINSALNQTYKNIKIIVVDDCSTDNTIGIIKHFGKKIKVISHKENFHVSVARNRLKSVTYLIKSLYIVTFNNYKIILLFLLKNNFN